MEFINLFTRDGGFVTSVEIPKFRPRFEVISWGSRLFCWNEGHCQFRECFVFPADTIESNRAPRPQVGATAP